MTSSDAELYRKVAILWVAEGGDAEGISWIDREALQEMVREEIYLSNHICPECGGDGADHEDSSKDCWMCDGSGRS
jgi:hypothetical protein